MSATNQHPDEPQVSSTTNVATKFTDWHTTLDPKPTQAEEKAARETTLAMGNVTSVGSPDNGERSDKHDRLDSHNRDNQWKYRVDVDVANSVDTQFKRKTLLAFAHQVSLSPLQRQMALDRFLALDLPRCGLQMELVAFCVCAVILNEDAKSYFNKKIPYYPTKKPSDNHPEFAALQTRLIDQWGTITKSQITSAYEKIRQGSLPTSNERDSGQSHTGADEVQRRPSYCPDWAVPLPS
jgi:hypothetical protein